MLLGNHRNSFCYDSVKKGIDDYANMLRAGSFDEINSYLGTTIDSYESGAIKALSWFISPLKRTVQYSGLPGFGSVLKFCSEFDLKVSQSNEYTAVLSTMAEVRANSATAC